MNRGKSHIAHPANPNQGADNNLLALIPAAHACLLETVAAQSHLARSIALARAAGAAPVRVISTSAPILAAARLLDCDTEHADDVAHTLASRSPCPALVLNPLHAAMHVEIIHAALNLLARDSAAVVTTFSQAFGRDDSHIAPRANGALLAIAPEITSVAKALSSPTLREIPTEPSLALRLDRPDDAVAIDAILRARAHHDALALFAAVDLVVFDFDGVMTNNQVLVLQDATEGALCNRSDGLGVGMLKKAGIPALVLSKEQNPVVGARCKKLDLECHQGIDDKLPYLRRLLAERNIPIERVAYVGNDLNDVACMSQVGLPIAVADAFEPALRAARLITRAKGGVGAVREVIDQLLASRTASASRATPPKDAPHA